MVRYLVIYKDGTEEFLPAAAAYDMALHTGAKNTGIPEHQALAARVAADATASGVDEDVIDLTRHAGDTEVPAEFLAAVAALSAAKSEPVPQEISTFVPTKTIEPVIGEIETTEAEDVPETTEAATKAAPGADEGPGEG